MNQILVTEKLYITPELRKKKKMYKINFILSIILVLILISFYLYSTYDRNKDESVSQEILASLFSSEEEEDTTTISSEDDVWVIALDAQEGYEQPTAETTSTTSASTNDTATGTTLGTYTTSDGTTYTTVGTINIPSISVNYPILSETSDSWLKISVCKFWGCNPNEVGNLCIAGHNYRNSRFFSKAVNLTVGDIIEITDLGGTTLEYAVYDKYTVDPNDVSCTSQLTNGKKIVTLITCTNDSKQRVVIKAEEIT